MLRRKSARLSDEAWAGWERACRERGVNFTALIEALGCLLHERADFIPDEATRRAMGVVAERQER